MRVKLGLYRHYKGSHYIVYGVARDSNTDRCVNDTDGDGDCAACARNRNAPCRQPREVVIYQCVDDETFWVRTVEDFTAMVHADGSPCDGTHCDANTVQVPRFEHVGGVPSP